MNLCKRSPEDTWYSGFQVLKVFNCRMPFANKLEALGIRVVPACIHLSVKCFRQNADILTERDEDSMKGLSDKQAASLCIFPGYMLNSHGLLSQQSSGFKPAL